jgi:hypothetical protein
MDRIIIFAPALAIIAVTLGLAGYIVALALATFAPNSEMGKPVRAWFEANAACNLGIPCSAIAAFAIVASLLRVFPPEKVDGDLAIKAFSLEFTGPSGPVTLWLICFLGFVIAIKLLTKHDQVAPSSN